MTEREGIVLKKKRGKKRVAAALVTWMKGLAPVVGVAIMGCLLIGDGFLLVEKGSRFGWILSVATDWRYVLTVWGVLVVACWADVFEFRVYLGGQRERNMRSYVNLLPLWTMGPCLVVVTWGVAGWLAAIKHALIFGALTLPQACGLPEKRPVTSTFLGRGLPLVLMVMSWVMLDSLIVTVITAPVVVVTVYYVTKHWTIGQDWTEQWQSLVVPLNRLIKRRRSS